MLCSLGINPASKLASSPLRVRQFSRQLVSLLPTDLTVTRLSGDQFDLRGRHSTLRLRSDPAQNYLLRKLRLFGRKKSWISLALSPEQKPETQGNDLTLPCRRLLTCLGWGGGSKPQRTEPLRGFCLNDRLGKLQRSRPNRQEPNSMLDPSADLPDETPITAVRLPTRISNALSNAGLRTLGEVRDSSDAALLSFQDLGGGSVRWLRERL